MTHRLARFVVALVSVAALAVAGAAAGGASTATAHCAPGSLSAVFVNASGAAGSVIAEYGFRNDGSSACRLEGFPTVQMLKSSGAKLSTTEQHAAPGALGITEKTVVLKPKAVAYFGVDYPAQTGFGNLHCPTSASLRLTAPGASDSLVLHGRGANINAYGGSEVALHCGILRVTPVSADKFQ